MQRAKMSGASVSVQREGTGAELPLASLRGGAATVYLFFGSMVGPVARPVEMW
jgi:hypothetical protein